MAIRADASEFCASFYGMHCKLQRTQPTFGSIRFHVRKIEAEKGEGQFSVEDLYQYYPMVEQQLVRNFFEVDQERQKTLGDVWESISSDIQIAPLLSFNKKSKMFKLASLLLLLFFFFPKLNSIRIIQEIS